MKVLFTSREPLISSHCMTAQSHMRMLSVKSICELRPRTPALSAVGTFVLCHLKSFIHTTSLCFTQSVSVAFPPLEPPTHHSGPSLHCLLPGSLSCPSWLGSMNFKTALLSYNIQISCPDPSAELKTP